MMEKETPKLCVRPQSRLSSCVYPNCARRPSSASSTPSMVLSIGGAAIASVLCGFELDVLQLLESNTGEIRQAMFSEVKKKES